MIIPVQPVPVRISLETQAINNGGYVGTDIDIEKMIRDAESVQYELNLCYGTTSLYRSTTYHVNKYLKTITFFFMVSTDLFSATLSASNKRCTFAKIPFGDQLPAVTSDNAGYVLTVDDAGQWTALPASGGSDPETLDDVSTTTGLTLTIPSYELSQQTFAQGHIFLFGNGIKAYSSDFCYYPSNGFNFSTAAPTSGTGFRSAAVMSGNLQSGRKFTYSSSEPQPPTSFSALVVWYYNPMGCTLEEGEYRPEDAPTNSQGL